MCGAELCTLCVHDGLHVVEVSLLRAEDRARAHDAEPTEALGCGHGVVLEKVEGEEGACAAEACLAVHGDGAL